MSEFGLPDRNDNVFEERIEKVGISNRERRRPCSVLDTRLMNACMITRSLQARARRILSGTGCVMQKEPLRPESRPVASEVPLPCGVISDSSWDLSCDNQVYFHLTLSTLLGGCHRRSATESSVLTSSYMWQISTVYSLQINDYI